MEGAGTASPIDRLQRLVDSLAERLHRPVLLDDPELRPLAHSPQRPEDADRVRTISILTRQPPREAAEYLRRHGVGTSREALEIPACPEIGLDARLCHPVLDEDRILGFLWVVNGLELADEAAELVGDVADAAAQLLAGGRSRDREQQRAHLRHLLRSPRPVARDAAAELIDSGAFPERGSFAVLVANISSASQETLDEAAAMRISRALRAYERGLRCDSHIAASEGEEVVALLGHVDEAELERLVPDLAARLRETMLEAVPGPDWQVAVGIGSIVDSLVAAGRSYAQAAQAAVVAARIPQVEDVLRWADAGIYRMLLSAEGGSELSEQDVPAGVLRLLEHPGGEVLLHTLETYLDSAGDAQRTTAALFLARGSLYYRLHRIEEIAEIDLRSGQDRLVLHLGLKLARIVGAYLPVEAGNGSGEAIRQAAA